MKILKKVLLGLTLCFAFVIVLTSCSNVTKSYAEKISNAYSSGNSMKYDDVKKDLGDECIDLTKDQNGLIIAVKGMTAANYKEKLEKASSTEKFDFLSIPVVKGECQRAYFAEATATDILAATIGK